ncbi:MAG: proprotein convertase P-domain-containing protein [Chitinophagales bacterium]|nr:proprotein convertase P-domain-containing protein [Chitinophagales bacterium]
MLQKQLFSAFLLLLCGQFALAQNLWSPTFSESEIALSGERQIIPDQYRVFQLDLPGAENLLAQAPLRDEFSGAEFAPLIFEVPMPDGQIQHFKLHETPVMAPELQARYRQIRTFTGYGLEDPTAMLKCDLTPQGFHAMIQSARHGQVYIDPYSVGNRSHYVVYFKKNYRRSRAEAAMACYTEPLAPETELELGHEHHTATPESSGDCRLRRYRLALACTGEYATFHGGTKPLVLAAMVTLMNRVNGVYEKDLAVTMQLVPNNDTLIFLNAASDPYDNNSLSAQLPQNVTTCNNRIGAANYDIGHCFSTSGEGGLAGIRVVCGNNKARGGTGSSSPIGDPFAIDYVVHEMGHQFGANHTQNNNCNRVAGAAMEPGSGSTIMAYAGICAPNVQNNSDDYFHAISIQEISVYINTGAGNNCPIKISTGNNAPTVNAGPDRSIPKSTPFMLTAIASDPDMDSLTYCWEQMDPEFGAVMPPAATNANGPMFRSFKPTPNPSRVFPRLQDLANNVNPTWEKLPSVARNLKFRVTVRDNYAGASCTAEDDVVIAVDAASGPFQVTAPNTNVAWTIATQETVTWNVANSNNAPVSCANVQIALSTDGGLTYPHILAASVPNNGSATVEVPNLPSTTCRVRVMAVGNVFFDISNQNFRIQAPVVPTFLMEVPTANVVACVGQSQSFTLSTTALSGFNTPITLSASGLPAGANAVITPNPLTPGATATVTLSGFTPAAVGNYSLTLTATGGSVVRTETVALVVQAGAPEQAPQVSAPLEGATGLSLTPTLSWAAIAGASSYKLEYSIDPSFVIFNSINTPNTSVVLPALPFTEQVYYWRVRGSSVCGDGPFSETHAFQTGTTVCNVQFSSTDVPTILSPNSAGTISSVLTVGDSRIVTDVNLNLEIAHSWVGDLSAWLVSPLSDTIRLFEQPGAPDLGEYGCDQNNISVTLDDEAAATAQLLESTCTSNAAFAISGAFKALEGFAAFDNQSAAGEWKLLVNDAIADDGGQINSWSLDFCLNTIIPAAVLLQNNPLSVPKNGSNALNNNNLEMALNGTASQGFYTLRSLPQYGNLRLNGTTLGIGNTFNQADIAAGNVTYQHNGGTESSDQFLFDAQDASNKRWLSLQTFQINIVDNNLAVNAVQTQTISCAGGADGQISASASGLDGQYQYSLNGGPLQNSPVFGNLSAGSYTVVVSGSFGFTAQSSAVVLTAPTAVQVSSSVDSDDLTITATGGAGNYTYSINGGPFQSANVFTDLPNGVYTIAVQDANGCTGAGSAIIAVNTLVAQAVITQQVQCFGAADGAFSVSISGGQAPIEYILNGNGTPQSSPVFSGLAAGVYTVLVRDAQGFEYTTAPVSITEPSLISVSTIVNLNDLTANANGGSGGYTYSVDGQSFQASNIFVNLPNGNYTLTVKDQNGCTTSANFEINVAALAVSLQNAQNVSCFGENNGSITLNANGGIPPYSYSLDGVNFQNNATFSNLAPGIYTPTVKDAEGNVQTAFSYEITQPAEIVVTVLTVGNDAVFNTNLAQYTYYTLNGVQNASLIDLANGVNVLAVYDQNGCSGETSFTINYTIPTLNPQVLIPDPCDDVANVFVEVTGGLPAFQFSLNGGPVQNTGLFTGLSAGLYTITFSDGAGTMLSTNVAVSTIPQLQLAASSAFDSIIATPGGGTPPYRFRLQGQPGGFQTSNIFPNLANGTYTVIVSDNNNCTATATVTVNFVGTADLEAAWGVNLAPNPGSGLFRLQLEQAPANLQLSLLNLQGQRLYQEFFEANSASFNTSLDFRHLPAGMYLLQVSDGRRSMVLRLALQR